jgi:threonine/homoserine/homoserine lactone efflux protein
MAGNSDMFHSRKFFKGINESLSAPLILAFSNPTKSMWFSSIKPSIVMPQTAVPLLVKTVFAI